MPVYAPFARSYTREPTRPSGGVQPGARALMEWTVESWDQADGIDDPDPGNLGIYNPRDICGNPWPEWECVGSQHARGAAIDVAFPNVGEGGHPEGWKYARWLVANADVLGVQEVIYARRRWNNQTRRWAKYNGPSPHLDHVHAALNASGARYLTLARIQSVAPKPPTPPAPLEDDMAFIAERKTTSTGIFLFEETRRTKITAGDLAAFTKRFGAVVPVSTGGWALLIKDRQLIQ